MKKTLFLTFITGVLFLGCEDTNQTSLHVTLYSQAPVLRAVIKDAEGQIATQDDLSQNNYRFKSAPVFPIVATSNTKDSFIDMDFDGVRSASDIMFNDTLYSVTSLISLTTTALLENADIDVSSLDYNVTKYKNATSQYAHAFSISSNDLLTQTPLESTNVNLAVLTDTIYDARMSSEFNASNPDALDKQFNIIQNFYNEYLGTKTVADAAQYHAFFNALKLLDEKKILRSQQNTMPSIPSYINRDYEQNIQSLPSSALLSSTYNQESNLAYWAMKIDQSNEVAYLAAGNDGFDAVDIRYAQARLENQENDGSGFGTSIDYMDRDAARCIFLADQENQLVIYGLWPLDHANDPNATSFIDHYRNTTTSGAKTFDVDYSSTNAKNSELLLVSNGAAGLEIFDVAHFTCREAVDLNDTHRINSTAIGSDTYSSVISSNQKIVYIADGVNGLISVDISGAQPQILKTTPLQNSEVAYNLHTVPNSNELYVSTDNGIQIYNTDNSGDILYRGLYATEGSRANVLGETLRVSLSHNHKALFVADITGGMKIIDISDSTNPELCGAAYFSGANIIERTAVRDVTLLEQSDGRKQVYVANDSNGLIVIDDASHLLFEHCKGLLD
jgi:hypothetical protein